MSFTFVLNNANKKNNVKITLKIIFYFFTVEP